MKGDNLLTNIGKGFGYTLRMRRDGFGTICLARLAAAMLGCALVLTATAAAKAQDTGPTQSVPVPDQTVPAPDQSSPLHTASRTELDVVKVVLAQEKAWNAGDVEGFVKGFK